ncbi:hypothetical protein CON64_18545 [Bacillus pseudomycoides]|nr:hypothetical protein CON64_18545 [Bacillus pseudomycoides]
MTTKVLTLEQETEFLESQERCKDFRKWFDRYQINWCTASQLQRLIPLKVITQEEREFTLEYREVHGRK